MARVSRAISSVYVPSVINRFIFGQGVVIYFIMQLLVKKFPKTNLIYSQARCSADRHFVYFDNRYGNHSADGIFDIAAMTVHFVVKSPFSRLSVR